MAYLDKNGIPRVDEATEIHNKHINNTINMLKSINNSIEQSCYLIRNDKNYISNWEEIVENLERCKESVNIQISKVQENYVV